MTMMPTSHGQPRDSCAHFGVDNLYATLSEAIGAELTFTGSEHLVQAYDSELPKEQFRAIAEGIAGMQLHPELRHDYIARQAFLVAEILVLPKWGRDTREAVAYAVLRVGMAHHGYQLGRHGSSFLVGLEPKKLFLLHSTYASLLAVITRAYELVPVAAAA